MSPITVGERPRPRVALLGYDEEAEEEEPHLLLKWLQNRFPTVWHGYGSNSLAVHSSEIDLTIALRRTDGFANDHHLISFCYAEVPGPCNYTEVVSTKLSLLSEYTFPGNHSLPIDKRRKTDFRSLGSARETNILELNPNSAAGLLSGSMIADAERKVAEGALAVSTAPMATIYVRDNDKGVAVLPLDLFDKIAWIDLLVDEWSQIDPVSFPDGGGQWSKTKEWMTPEERSLADEIESLEAEKAAKIAQLDSEILDKEISLAQLRQEVNSGTRGLLTEQGDALVEKVEKAFQDIGFGVTDMDSELEPEQHKREDLRLTDPDDPDWEALVEIKGYGRSDGKTSDLQKMQRYVNFYISEKDRLPSKIIYLVNGPIDVTPSQRGLALGTANDDVREFKNSNGLVIGTTTLYKALCSKSPEEIRKSIIDETGRWEVEGI